MPISASGAPGRFFDRGLKLNHLRLLMMLGTLGQVRLVAERLHVTQPAVSKQLAELEAGLGTKLLERVGNRLRFTTAGEAMLRHAREVLLQLEQARHELDALGHRLSGRVTIGAVATVLPVFALELVLQLKKQAPNIELAIVEDTSDQLFPRLVAGEFDIVFSRTATPKPDPVHLTGDRVLEDPIVLACGAIHPLAARRAVRPDDLAGMPWILPPRAAPTYAALSGWMRANGLSFPDGCLESISLTANQALLRAYPFIGLMPLSLATSGTNRETLRVLELKKASFLPTVWMHRGPHPNAAAQAVVACAFAVRERGTIAAQLVRGVF